MPTQQPHNPYDEMPYQSHAFAATAPFHMEAIARLFSLNPASAHKARILELGCASGGNIIPLALYNPTLEILGIDYSAIQIHAGQAIINSLALDNIELRQLSIDALPKDIGFFDYIICHGVYSWVPQNIQQAIFHVAHNHLNDNGVALISYNTYPGWKLKEITRDAMMFHTKNIPNLSDKIGNSLNILNYLHKVAPKESIFKKVIDDQINQLDKITTNYLAHEFLESNNHPCYFKTFIDQAQQHGLSYLAESDLSAMFAAHLAPEDRNQLAQASQQNQVDLEQYLDFVYNRTFRQTLLCKMPYSKDINYGITAQALEQLAFTSKLHHMPANNASDHPEDHGRYAHNNNADTIITVTGTLNRALIDLLIAQHQSPLAYSCIISTLKDCSTTLLNQALYELITLGAVYIFPHNSVNAKNHTTCPEQPCIPQKIIDYALLTGRLPTPLHKEIIIDHFMRILLPLMNGENNLSDLKQHLHDAVKTGVISFEETQTQTPVTHEQTLATLMETQLTHTLELFLHQGLFA